MMTGCSGSNRSKKRCAPLVAKKAGLEGFIKNGSVMMGDDKRLDIVRLPSGLPQVDKILNGGIPYGRYTLIVGPESTGKTVLLQHLVAQAQQGGGNGRTKCMLVDMERSFDRGWWERSGVDVSKLYVAQPTNGEEAVDIMAAILQEEELGVLGLDSIAMLNPQVVQEKESGERTVGALAQLVSKMYNKITPVMRDTIIVTINQLRDNIGGYEDVIPGGRSVRYNSHIRLRTRRVEWIKEKDQRVGYVMEVHAQKNKVGDPEGMCEIPFRFGTQFDIDGSFIDEGIEKGLIRSAGPYYIITASEGNDIKFLGKVNLRGYFSDTPGAMDWLKGRLGEA